MMEGTQRISDAYLRLARPVGPDRHFGTASGGLVMVDLATPAASLGASEFVRSVHPASLQNAKACLLRPCPGSGPVVGAIAEWGAVAAQIAVKTQEPISVGILQAEPGEDIRVEWVTPTRAPWDDVEVIRRARAIEVEALLWHGRADLRARGHSYVLPSGAVAARFVRTAEAFREPQDAHALAWWLSPYLFEGVSFVVDTSTLLPLVIAAHARMEADGVEPGPVVVLPPYPNRLEFSGDLAMMLGARAGVVALISASRSGDLRDNVAAALTDRAPMPGTWRVITLAEVGSTTGAATGGHHVWASLAPVPDPPDGLPKVRVDPWSFLPTGLPQPWPLVMPDIRKAGEVIGPLLEMYDEVDGVGLECRPPARTELRRGRALSAVRFYPHQLLGHGRFLGALRRRLEAVRDAGDRERSVQAGWCDPNRLRGFDAVAVISEDAGVDGFSAAVGVVADVFGGQDAALSVFDATSLGPETDVERVSELRDAGRVLVMTMGAVTGGTLQELNFRVHRVMTLAGREKGAYEVCGLALHARPAVASDWEGLCNAFSRSLMAAWLTYLPWRSPLREEKRVLDELTRQHRSGVAGEPLTGEMVDRRGAYCVPVNVDDGPPGEGEIVDAGHWDQRVAAWVPGQQRPDPHAVFWGQNMDGPAHERIRLLPTSAFGHEVRAVATLVGVGSAMQYTRTKGRGADAPPWVHFDMPKLIESYWDTLILASALRWLQPREALWERADGTATPEELVRKLWHRPDEARHRVILVSEMMLATAQGKAPASLAALLIELAGELRAEGSLGSSQLAALDAGCDLLRVAGLA